MRLLMTIINDLGLEQCGHGLICVYFDFWYGSSVQNRINMFRVVRLATNLTNSLTCIVDSHRITEMISFESFELMLAQCPSAHNFVKWSIFRHFTQFKVISICVKQTVYKLFYWCQRQVPGTAVGGVSMRLLYDLWRAGIFTSCVNLWSCSIIFAIAYRSRVFCCCKNLVHHFYFEFHRHLITL